MEIYLPIAQMSVHWLVILGMGFGVGFLSGLFGVGGGFLLTPLLVLYGIPSGIAVATTLSHVTASSISGALAQWRRRAIDLKMAGVMLCGGVAGTVLGVWLFAVMRRAGQMDLVVSISYVLLLGTVGGLMLRESLAALRLSRNPAGPAPFKLHRGWIQALPLKTRFRQSRLYISVIPPILIGVGVGTLSAIMGIGGGFIIVPAMIYILRMPTNMVIGTSLAQIIVITAFTTLLQATSNYAVDIMLGGVLVLGGVVGAQFGTRVGDRLRGEQLRLLLALLVLAVCLRVLWGLIATPIDLYSVAMGA